MEHLNSSINNPPTREKFRIMSTVWFVLQKPIASRWRGIGPATWTTWERLCAKLFGFNQTEIYVDHRAKKLMRDPTTYNLSRDSKRGNDLDGTMYGLLKETKRLIPEPILSHRVACIALSCMEYLHREDPANSPPMQDNLLAAWAMKSKRLPWLWRQRTRVTSILPTWDYYWPEYSFPQSLRRSHQMLLHSKGIQSKEFYQVL